MAVINKTFRLFCTFQLKKIDKCSLFNCYYSTSKKDDEYATPVGENEEYDLIVLGGGSGGLSCAMAAGEHGARVIVLDYTQPSPHGSTWDIGGTCINAGCIPKKLFHHAALLGQAMEDADTYGWGKAPTPNKLNWQILVKSVQNYIKSINWISSTTLRDSGIRYLNGKAEFLDPKMILATFKDNTQMKFKGKSILIAVGGRPKYMNIPGADLAITSDDIFSLQQPPGKTAIVGAGYVALECAGFLNSLHFPVTVMVRGKVLRSFDQQMANIITKDLQNRKISILKNCQVTGIKKMPDGKLEVTYSIDKNEKSEVFNTVVFAIGRQCNTQALNLAAANVKTDPETGKIVCKNEQTNVPHIYAVGDVMHGAPELTPVAVQAGELLAHRLFGESHQLMDYANIPTTLFTPLEYGCVGISEDRAIEIYGIDNIEVYHTYYKPLEFSIPDRCADFCYIKIICMLKERNILGIHFLGPSAGEVLQGYAVAMKCNVTMEELRGTVGIHPTVSQEITRLTVTKRSLKDPKPKRCCS